jgi:glutathione synthase/RimK-type ligase-like ATP-grasp enzyme
MPPQLRRLAVAANPDYETYSPDWALLRAALDEVDIAVSAPHWDDPAVDWTSYDLVLANGVWGYIHQLETFLAWTEHVAKRTIVVNPSAALRWNADKHYLCELADAGLPTIATTFVDRLEQASDIDFGSGPFVVKPTVSGGAFQSARYEPTPSDHAAARTHLNHLLEAGRTVMLQPYQQAVDTEGETGLIYLGGTYSHAIHKAALLQPGVAATDSLADQMVITSAEPTPAQLELAQRVLHVAEQLHGPLTYARVDLIPDTEGAPALIELEILDPALYLDLHPPGATLLAEVLRSALP